jgi:hypothetical protein
MSQLKLVERNFGSFFAPISSRYTHTISLLALTFTITPSSFNLIMKPGCPPTFALLPAPTAKSPAALATIMVLPQQQSGYRMFKRA